MRGGATPDPSLLAELRAMVERPKFWISSGEVSWVDAGGKPRGFKFREHLAFESGMQPAGLFVDAYYKPSTLSGVPDKLSVGLFYRTHRILAVDEDGPSHHFNSVGIGRPYYMQYVGHPQLHTLSDDAIDDYAEPLRSASLPELWREFLRRASVVDAPDFNPPVLQLDFGV
jgi:hypothetical protein